MDAFVDQMAGPIDEDEVVLHRRSNAKRYIARVDDEGRIQVTIPRRGSKRAAISFANEHCEWLREQQRMARERQSDASLSHGDRIWFRGDQVELLVSKDWGRPVLRFGDEVVFIADESTDLRRPIEKRMRAIARSELPPRLRELGERLGVRYSGVSIRGQKTRWGSCSSTGTISLNWRLMMVPPEVSDYVLIHELTHLKEMNHSPRFWSLVEDACPRYREYERWLDQHQLELGW